MSDLRIDRRQALKLISGGVIFYLTACQKKITPSNILNYKIDPLFNLDNISPINKFGVVGSFSGDNPEKMHEVLWDVASFLKSNPLPTPSEEHELVIIGGGMSGLMSGYFHLDKKPMILEQNQRFGGNAKGEEWNGIKYGIGAAYFTKPQTGSTLDQFLKDIKAYDFLKHKNESDLVELNQKILRKFFEGETADEEGKKQFIKFHEILKEFYFEKNNRKFPEVPIVSEESIKTVLELDQYSLHEYLLKELNVKKLHPHLETFLEHYCFSSFNGSMTEISAASGINFLAGEVEGLMVAPGGNGMIAHRLLEILSSHLPKENFRENSLVFNVEDKNTHVEIAYVDQVTRKVNVVKAKKVIMSIPKFIVKKVLKNIEPERLEAIEQLKYRSYLVAHAMINKPLKEKFYDMFLLGDGKVNLKEIEKSARDQMASDIVCPNYATPHPEKTILSFYRAVPFDFFRAELLEEGSYEKFTKEFTKQIEQLIPMFEFKKSDIDHIRLTRWGHPLPVAEKGLIQNGTIEKIKAPFGKNIFFIEQDNWMMPALETCFAESYKHKNMV